MKLASIALLLVLTGCAQDFWQPHPVTTSVPQTHWERQGASSEDFRRERGQCLAQAFANTMDEIQAYIVFSGCMQGKGWYQIAN